MILQLVEGTVPMMFYDRVVRISYLVLEDFLPKNICSKNTYARIPQYYPRTRKILSVLVGTNNEPCAVVRKPFKTMNLEHQIGVQDDYVII